MNNYGNISFDGRQESAFCTHPSSGLSDDVLYSPGLSAALLHNQADKAILTCDNLQTSLCSSVLDRPILRMRHNQYLPRNFLLRTQTNTFMSISRGFALYQFEIPQHVVLVLLCCLALVEAWLCARAEVHQATVAIVLVRFDLANIKLTIGAIVTELCRECSVYQQSAQHPGKHLGKSCTKPRAHTCGE